MTTIDLTNLSLKESATQNEKIGESGISCVVISSYMLRCGLGKHRVERHHCGSPAAQPSNSKTIKTQITAFCRAQPGVVGMRSGVGLPCYIAQLDSWAPTFIDANGHEAFAYQTDATPNPQVVLFHGPTWEDVLEQIEVIQ